jgi:N-acyl-D-aspartate/D-glutamate deacylase
MNSQEFREMVQSIREALEYSYIGLSSQDIQNLNKRLDSDAYKAAVAVERYFELKRRESK